LRLAIADPDSPSRTIDVTRIIRLPASVERWQPSAVLDEDQQEDERIVRDQEYRMVFPGTLRKDAL
jgi:hypothetical protein